MRARRRKPGNSAGSSASEDGSAARQLVHSFTGPAPDTPIETSDTSDVATGETQSAGPFDNVISFPDQLALRPARTEKAPLRIRLGLLALAAAKAIAWCFVTLLFVAYLLLTADIASGAVLHAAKAGISSALRATQLPSER